MQFTVYRNDNAASQKHVPFLLAVQSNLVDSASTCVVVPLITSERAGSPVSRLMPTFVIGEASMVMDTLQLAAIPRTLLVPLSRI